MRNKFHTEAQVRYTNFKMFYLSYYIWIMISLTMCGYLELSLNLYRTLRNGTFDVP